MSTTKQPSLSTGGEGWRFSRLRAAIDLLGILILVSCIGSASAQRDESQFLNRNSQAQQVVSTNQLLAPRKAQQETERARQDILRGHLDSAQKELTSALNVAPHYGVALAMQGAVYLETGNIESAATAFQNAIDEDPSLGAAYLGAGMVLMAKGRFKEALTPLDRAASLVPNSWYMHLETGLAHLGLGNTNAATKEADLAEQSAGADPERNSGVAYLRAMVSKVMKDSDRTKKYLAEAISRNPDGYYASLAKRGTDRIQAAGSDTK